MSSRLVPIVARALLVPIATTVVGCTEPAPEPSATPPDSVLIDSVRTVLDRGGNAERPSDSTTLRRWTDRLLTLGDSLASTRPDWARTLLEEARRASLVLGDSARLAASVYRKGQSYAAQSQYEDAVAQYRRAGSIHQRIGHRERWARNETALGDALQEWNRSEDALEHYRKALAMYRDEGVQTDRAHVLNEIGAIQEQEGDFDQALHSYQAALSLYREQQNPEGFAKTLNNIGNVRQIQGRYTEALEHLHEARTLCREHGDPRCAAHTQKDIGVVHYRRGRYSDALETFREALTIYREEADPSEIADALNRVGAGYSIQGRYQKALSHYQEALSLNQERGNEDGVARNLNNIGIIHRHQGRYVDAQTNFEKALSINRSLDDRRDVAINLSNLGEVLRLQGRDEEALARYREALSINRDLGVRESIASNLNNIGKVRESQEEYGKALDHYRKALSLRQTMESHRQVTSLRMIGSLHLDRGQLEAATDTLERAVHLAEELRQSVASPEARRSLLSTQISTYRALTSAHIRSGQTEEALRSAEQARARLLAERLTDTAKTDTTFSIPSARELRQTLSSEEVAVLYANPGTARPLTAFVVTRDTTYGRELPDSTIWAGVQRTYSDVLRRLRETKGPLTAALENDELASPQGAPSLAETVRLYRSYLIQEDADRSSQRDLAGRLYNLLVDPLEVHHRQNETLTIVPAGVLGYIPFETLRAPDGRHLIEEMDVRYAQSLTVLRQLQTRDYTDADRPLLALGGADYGTPPPELEEPVLAEARRGPGVESEEHAQSLLRAAERRLERGKSARPTYAQLGYDQWPALFGTELEVRKLNRAVGNGTTVLTGTDASEARLRQLSASGDLTKYRHVHFATHGLAVPEAPRLSALVLSQTNASDDRASEDGYVTMHEIADLDLRTDVAVLSACRTGLGRIIAGEGVVNLSHAFLRAGANATLVSQWRVLDWSTQQFMAATYRKVKAEGMSFVEATADVKREFIAGTFGERNPDPLRWAPFVYYGRE